MNAKAKNIITYSIIVVSSLILIFREPISFAIFVTLYNSFITESIRIKVNDIDTICEISLLLFTLGLASCVFIIDYLYSDPNKS